MPRPPLPFRPSLLGHRVVDTDGARWSVPLAVARTWKAGGDDDEQVRVCALVRRSTCLDTGNAEGPAGRSVRQGPR